MAQQPLTPLLVVVMISGTTALTCFAPVTSTTFRHVLGFVPTANCRQQCEFECVHTKKCTAYSYGKSCTLLGYAYSTVSCKAPELIYVAQATPCPERNDIERDFGVDPCIVQAFPGLLNLAGSPLCPRGTPSQPTNYIVRAVRPDGSRISIDNDDLTKITFNSMLNMWHFTFRATAQVESSYEEWLVAAMCVTADARCACDPLPMITEVRAGKVPARTEVNGVCNNPNHFMRVIGYKDQRRSQNIDAKASNLPNNFKITCRAGLWLLGEIGTAIEFSIRMATCSP